MNFHVDIEKIFAPAATALLVTALLLALRFLLMKVIRRKAERNGARTGWDILESLRNPSVYWCVALGLYTGIDWAELPEKQALYLNRGLHVLVIFSMTLAAANLAGRLFRSHVKNADLPIPATGLVQALIKGTIITVGILVILAVFGISITPIITALGVGGLAVALALQDTLANLFAGIHILMEESIRVGDFVRLENGLEGHINDISWRTTRVRMLTGNMVIIPNSTLAKSTVINFNIPVRASSVTVKINTASTADPDTVEKVLGAEARELVESLPAVRPGTAVFVRCSNITDSGVEYTVGFSIEDVSELAYVQHELRKRLIKRLNTEGLGIAVPLVTARSVQN